MDTSSPFCAVIFRTNRFHAKKEPMDTRKTNCPKTRKISKNQVENLLVKCKENRLKFHSAEKNPRPVLIITQMDPLTSILAAMT